VERALSGTVAPLLRGASWTTDAPFRESASLIAARRAEGIISVEMEAAALLAMGRALGRPVIEGKGACAQVARATVLIGNRRLMDERRALLMSAAAIAARHACHP
jgi:hypothetical protein